MIVIDTSALIAILQDEPAAFACSEAIARADRLCISAGTLAEAHIVAVRRDLLDELTDLVDRLEVEVVPVTAGVARAVGDAYQAWGKGKHPAALNFGDCFAYALARQRECPLLFVGDDFARTDLAAALS